jgi:hypothetical protein
VFIAEQVQLLNCRNFEGLDYHVGGPQALLQAAKDPRILMRLQSYERKYYLVAQPLWTTLKRIHPLGVLILLIHCPVKQHLSGSKQNP